VYITVATFDVNKLDAQKEFNVKENQRGNVYTNKEKKVKNNCYACGRDNHKFAECKYKEYT